MFYVKAKLNEDCEINIDLTDENIYTRCPDCGCEFAVDIVGDPDVDLYGTQICCSECSRKRQETKHKENVTRSWHVPAKGADED